jgi:hypothetical protein
VSGRAPPETAWPQAPVEIERLHGELLVLDGTALARAFFRADPSSVGPRSFDSLAGCGRHDMITADDITAINRTMRARSSHASWEPLLNRHLRWLSEVDPELDLILLNQAEWEAAEAERLARAALEATLGTNRGPSVATGQKKPCLRREFSVGTRSGS